MSGRASAARYARALLEVSIRESDPARVGRELSSFTGLVREHTTLREVLTSPTISAPAKHRVIQELSGRLNPAAPLAKLLLMLADRDRLGLLEDLNGVYQERLLEHQQILQAEVTTATSLEPARLDALKARLATATGRQVVMSAKVDPTLIGGMVARIGSTVYDGSVSSQLSKMRERLLRER